MKRWTLVSGDFAPNGGMDIANFELARHLAATDQVHLVSHHVDNSLLELENVSWTRVVRPMRSNFLGERFLRFAGSRLLKNQGRLGFRALCNGGNSISSDINWVHYVHAAHSPLSTANWLGDAKKRLNSVMAIREERISLRAAKYVICNSLRTANEVTNLIGVSRDKVHVVYLSADSRRFAYANAKDRESAKAKLDLGSAVSATFIGDPDDPRKAFDVLLQAWSQLSRDDDWNAILLVVGKLRRPEFWAKKIRDLGLNERIRFLGYRSDIECVLAATDLLVHPSRYEPYGLGVHEAITRGCPVLVSAAAGVAERFPDELKYALIHDVEDVDDLMQKLQQWKAKFCFWRESIRSFSDELRCYSWADMSEKMVQVTLTN